MNILYIGSSGPLSYLPIQTLLESQFNGIYNIVSIAIDGLNKSNLPTVNANSQTLESIAFYNNIPLLKLSKNIVENVTAISKLQPDIILVSCYARKLPNEIISLAKIGCFNLHPSLLPKYRGPTPLFWQFREGEAQFGVTLHRVTERFDDGNILAQQSIEMPDGVSKEEASRMLAKLASALVVKTFPLLLQSELNEVKQDESEASYQSFAKKQDYTVAVTWTAQRIYNFICANKRQGLYFSYEMAGKIYKLIDALSYQEKTYQELNDDLYVINDNVITFKCRTGYIKCVFIE